MVNNYFIEVPGVGRFEIAPRRMGTHCEILAEYSSLTKGVETPTHYLQWYGSMVATLKVMIVSGPNGWDMDDMDPLDPETTETLAKVFNALRAKEDSFRAKRKQPGTESGTGTGGDDTALVSAELQTQSE